LPTPPRPKAVSSASKFFEGFGKVRIASSSGR
jgi:hypothetical protein